jgi:hypothetical protein
METHAESMYRLTVTEKEKRERDRMNRWVTRNAMQMLMDRDGFTSPGASTRADPDTGYGKGQAGGRSDDDDDDYEDSGSAGSLPDDDDDDGGGEGEAGAAQELPEAAEVGIGELGELGATAAELL